MSNDVLPSVILIRIEKSVMKRIALMLIVFVGATIAHSQVIFCPGDSVLGILSRPPEMSFDSRIRVDTPYVYGRANNLHPRRTRIVHWALTNIWYVQPFSNTPYTYVCSDCTWSSFTHSWRRMTAVLVDSTYIPGSIRYDHPAFESGVVGWAEYPRSRPDLPIQFASYQWGVKVAEVPFDPGPNYFSSDTSNIWVDSNGLHLRIVYRNLKWTCPEVYLLRSLGYGSYTFQTTSRLDSLDPRAVFSMFLYESLTREIDIEFSRALAPYHEPV